MKLKKLLSLVLSLAMIIGTMGALATTASAAYNTTIKFSFSTVKSAYLSSATMYYSTSANATFTVGGSNPSYTAVTCSRSGATATATFSQASSVIYVLCVAKDTNGVQYLYGYNVNAAAGTAPGGTQTVVGNANSFNYVSANALYKSTVGFYSDGSLIGSSNIYKGAYYRASGSLPTPTKEGYTFAGWYTATSGGTRITDTSIVTLAGGQAQFLYAQWTADYPAQFATYKNQKLAEVSALKVEGNSDAVNALIDEAYANINALTYSSSVPFETNKALVDLYVTNLNSDIAAQKELEANQAEFERYKTERSEAAALLATDGDSDEVKALVTAAQAEIAALEYDSSQSLDDNKAAVTAIVTKLSSDIEEAKKPKAVFTNSITDTGYTAETPESEEKKGAIAVTVEFSDPVNFAFSDIAKYGFYFWKTDENETGISREVSGTLSETASDFYTVVYDLDESSEDIIVKPYVVLNDNTTVFGSAIINRFDGTIYDNTDKWLGTVDTMLANAGLSK